MADREKKTNMTFMSFPAEIRVQIYGILLKEDRTIALTVYRQYSTGGNRPVRQDFAPKIVRDNRDDYREKRRRGKVYNPSKRAWEPRTPIKTAILFANHQINTEATEALLNVNSFRFHNTNCLSIFLDVAGPRAHHLRSVEIAAGGWLKTGAVKILQKLGSTAKCLKHFRIDHSDICQKTHGREINPRRQDIVKACAGLFRLLQESHAKAGKDFFPLKAIDLYLESACDQCHYSATKQTQPPGPHSRDSYNEDMQESVCSCRCDEIDRNHMIYARGFRSSLAKALGMNENCQELSDEAE